MQSHLVRRRHHTLGLLIILSVAALGSTVAFADHAQKGPVIGTVVSGNCGGKASFVVDTPSGSAATVHTNKRTLCVPNSSAAVVAGFGKGDYILVRDQGKAKIAALVTYDTMPFAIPGTNKGLRGSYSSSTSDTVTLTSGHVSSTFVVDSNTIYIENGRTLTSPPAYMAGDEITARCREYTDGREWAGVVTIKSRKKHQGR